MTRKLDCEIKSADEPWTVITLTNGDKIKSRMVCTGIRAVMADDGEQAKGPDGKPAYEVDWQQIMAVQVKVVLNA
jgi:hypothetical protein